MTPRTWCIILGLAVVAFALLRWPAWSQSRGSPAPVSSVRPTVAAGSSPAVAPPVTPRSSAASPGLESVANQQVTTPLTELEECLRLEGEARRWALHDLFQSWGAVDPRAADVAARGLEHAADRFDALRGLAARWLQAEPRPALAWLRAYPEPGLREALLIEALPTWATLEPAEAAGFVGGLRDADVQTRAATALAEAWARTQPDAAFAWAATLAAQEARVDAQRAVLEALLPERTAAALRLVQTWARAEDASGLMDYIQSSGAPKP